MSRICEGCQQGAHKLCDGCDCDACEPLDEETAAGAEQPSAPQQSALEYVRTVDVLTAPLDENDFEQPSAPPQPAFRDFGPMSCCICGDPTINRKFLPSEEMIALHVCRNEQPAPPPAENLLRRVLMDVAYSDGQVANETLAAIQELLDWAAPTEPSDLCAALGDCQACAGKDCTCTCHAGAEQPSAPPQPADPLNCDMCNEGLPRKGETHYMGESPVGTCTAKAAAEPSVAARQVQTSAKEMVELVQREFALGEEFYNFLLVGFGNALAAAKREVMEEAARLVCDFCKVKKPERFNNLFTHRDDDGNMVACGALGIWLEIGGAA